MEFDKNTYTINEVSEILSINTSTLRNWEHEFNLKIPRNKKNHRFYTEKEIEVLKIIKEGREKNHSIDTIKKALEKHGIIEDQNSSATKIMKVDQITVEELQEAMFSKFKDVIGELVIERENKLRNEFEKKLEERDNILTEKIADKVRCQIESENKKLMDYIAATREEEKKKSLWSRLFSK